jgi:hypothetical protein
VEQATRTARDTSQTACHHLRCGHVARQRAPCRELVSRASKSPQRELPVSRFHGHSVTPRLERHIVLPSEAAVVRSVGVLTKKTGDLADGDGVRRRKV